MNENGSASNERNYMPTVSFKNVEINELIYFCFNVPETERAFITSVHIWSEFKL